MTMTGRFFEIGIRLLLGVVPLLAVVSSALLPSRTSHTAPSSNHPPRNFVLRKFRQSGEFALFARPSLRKADSAPSDFKDELDSGVADVEDDPTVTSSPPSVPFDLLPSPPPEPYSELVRFV